MELALQAQRQKDRPRAGGPRFERRLDDEFAACKRRKMSADTALCPAMCRRAGGVLVPGLLDALRYTPEGGCVKIRLRPPYKAPT